MASVSHFLLLFILISIFHQTTCGSIRLPSDEDTELLYCNSWRLSVETNNAGAWSPDPRCENYAKEYMYSKQYQSDQEVIASAALDFAKTVNIAGDGMDAWVFDVDDTLLSSFELVLEWKEEGINITYVPALNVSLKLYKELKNMGFTIFLLTGRDESLREITVSNLKLVGYNGWERLIMRGPKDLNNPAVVHKSHRRAKLMYEGYRIHGNSGDLWGDLLGHATAERSFKHPNPVYYFP